MLTYIKIDGFKSFQNFEMNLTPLTVIAGPNAAGKSNLFDALKLLSNLADTDKIQKAFHEQRGDMLELFTQFEDHSIATEMSFVVEMLVNPTITDTWGATERLRYTRMRYELKLHRFTNSIGMEDIAVIYEKLDTIKHASDKWIKILPDQMSEIWRPKVTTGKRQIPYIYTDIHNGTPTITVPQDGSQGKKRRFPLNNTTRTVLSSFDSVDFKHILAAREEMKSWKFLQLNPEDLRLPTSKTSGEDIIGSTGKNLAAALYRIKQADSFTLTDISRKLHSFLPNFIAVDVEDDEVNKQYVIVLYDVDGKKYTSRVLSEGTLRILALCILLEDSQQKGVLCFEEPENGIHPFRIKAMSELLRDLSTDFSDSDMPLRQVILNTHSTIFIQEIHKWLTDKYVTICLAQMVNRIVTINGERKKILASKMSSVPSTSEPPALFDQDDKVSIKMLNDFLTTGDNEAIHIN